MNAAAIRTAGKYLGAWGVIALSVGLVSFTFTLLGTMACAVLLGMMMGALKGAKWFSVMVSMVFPLVILGMTRSPRATLTPQQFLLLGALCFGAFWVTYLVSAIVFFCEQKDRKSFKPHALSPGPKPLARGWQADATSLTPATGSLGSAVPSAESCLEQLQGNWVCEASSAGSSPCKKVIQISEARLELKVIDGGGRTTLVARGEVALQSLPPA